MIGYIPVDILDVEETFLVTKSFFYLGTLANFGIGHYRELLVYYDPRYPPIVSLYLLDPLPTEKVEYLANAFFPENFCRSSHNSCFVRDVRRRNASFLKYETYNALS